MATMEQISKRGMTRGMTPQEDLCFWLGSLSTASMRCLAVRFAPYGITTSQFGILMMCSKGCADTVSGLSRVMPIDSAAVSRNVHSLAQRGLLERKPSQRDRRSATLSVTENGEVLLEELVLHVEANNQMLLQGIDGDEKEQFVTIIKTMLANTAAYETTRFGEPDMTG